MYSKICKVEKQFFDVKNIVALQLPENVKSCKRSVNHLRRSFARWVYRLLGSDLLCQIKELLGFCWTGGDAVS